MENCIFCKLANGDIPVAYLFENDQLVCFRDANPQTDTHLLLVPKKHYKDILELFSADEYPVFAQAFAEAVQVLTREMGLEDSGFRIINNCGSGAGQSVFHVHFHLMADEERLKDRLV